MNQFSSIKRNQALALRNDFSPFGNKLIQAGFVDREEMSKALIETRKSGKNLVEVLQQITGRELTPELRRQYKNNRLFELKIFYGVECFDPELESEEQNQTAELLGTFISVDICRRYQLLPLEKTEDHLVVGMVNPNNLTAQDELKSRLKSHNLNYERRVITSEDFQELIDKYIDLQIKAQQQEKSALEVDVSRELEKFGLNALEEVTDEGDEDITAKDAQDAPIIALVNKILAKGLQEGVSDIHVEPQEEALRIRFRKDGVLQQAFPPLPKKIIPAVVARFKIMADLDIAERRSPQDGKIRRIFQGRKVDFRMNTLPSRYGEKVCLRILDNSATQLGLDFLISHEGTLELVRELASRPFGLILVTGPTGSGKSTTLYSVLAERNDPRVNINTAEDPIEYSLPGITQVQVIREKGMDFSNILRAFMRQDPDVILVGETRDKETAKTAIEAALTGHLVLTTLHTNDAAGAIARLDEMGVEPFMVSGSLLGVLAQRLMRRVCSKCKIAYQPTKEELARFGFTSSADAEITLFKANTLTPDEIKEARAKGILCQKCNGAGYRGRVGVYEVMQVTERLATLINEGATTDRIKDAAVEEGMITLLAYSLNLVREGHTTLEEVERVTFTDSGLESELKAKRKSSLTCKNCGAEVQQEWIDCPYCLTPRFS